MAAIKVVNDFLEGFVNGTVGENRKHGGWGTIWYGGLIVLQYTGRSTHKVWDSDERRYRKIVTNEAPETVAYRYPDGSVLANANQLVFVGRRMAWGNEVRRSGPSEQQVFLESKGAVMFPFTLFDEAGLDARDFKWIVKPVAETVRIFSSQWSKTEIDRHFSGACVFAIGDNTYLFDVDRLEIEKHKIFNPFITRLPARVQSILEAYSILMPDEVKDAINHGIDVKRQGEFFFVKYSDTPPVKGILTSEEVQILKYPPSKAGFGLTSDRMVFAHDDTKVLPEDESYSGLEQEYQEAAIKYRKARAHFRELNPQSGKIGKSATGSHSVEKFVQKDDVTYASGTVKQDRREHGDLVLTGWYKVVANTGTISWTVTGNID